jgi:hypothetical protein
MNSPVSQQVHQHPNFKLLQNWNPSAIAVVPDNLGIGHLLNQELQITTQSQRQHHHQLALFLKFLLRLHINLETEPLLSLLGVQVVLVVVDKLPCLAKTRLPHQTNSVVEEAQ